jgi:hypothetical protein
MRVLWGVEQDRQCYDSNGLDSFPAEAVEGCHRFFELLLIIAHFFESRQEDYFCLAAIVDENS